MYIYLDILDCYFLESLVILDYLEKECRPLAIRGAPFFILYGAVKCFMNQNILLLV